MSWLGYTLDQTLDTPMPVLELAYKGVQDRLRWTHGGSEPEQPEEGVIPATAANVAARLRGMARRHAKAGGL